MVIRYIDYLCRRNGKRLFLILFRGKIKLKSNMEIEELIKLCSEYENLSVKKELYEYEIEANKKYPHLDWAIERDMLLLSKLISRKQEIQEILTDMQGIKF